jgi:hypothetical protein
MKWIDHIIYADYWTRTKVAFVFLAFAYGMGIVFIGHQRWGIWAMLAATVLFLLMLIHKRLAEPSETMQAQKQQVLPRWVSTQSWDYRIKVLVLLGVAVLGIAVESRNRHGITGGLTITMTATVLLPFILQALFPEHPRQRKPKPDESSKLKID